MIIPTITSTTNFEEKKETARVNLKSFNFVRLIIANIIYLQKKFKIKGKKNFSSHAYGCCKTKSF